jgi:hypothetical protein
MSLSQIQKVPFHIKSPYAKYFLYITWAQGFENWNIVRFSTPADGSCLFHALTNAFFEPYHTEKINEKSYARKNIIKLLRTELSKRLGNIDPDDPEGKTYYDKLNNGSTASFAKAVPEFSLSYMQKELDSDTPIGYGYLEFIANAINKDIYILEASRRDIYVLDTPSLIIKGNRNSIVLYYTTNHYELVGIENKYGTFDTHFSPNHSFIRFLYNKVFQKCNM